jgi:hypothetical protein
MKPAKARSVVGGDDGLAQSGASVNVGTTRTPRRPRRRNLESMSAHFASELRSEDSRDWICSQSTISRACPIRPARIESACARRLRMSEDALPDIAPKNA